MSVNYMFVPMFAVVQKFQQKYIKNHHDGSLQSPKGGPDAGHPRPGGHLARTAPGRARREPGKRGKYRPKGELEVG